MARIARSLLACWGAALVLSACSGGKKPAQSGVDVLWEDFKKEAREIPGLKDEILKGKSEKEAWERALAIIEKGTSKLDDASLIQYLQIISQLLAKASFEQCYHMALADLPTEEHLSLLSELPVAEQKAWFRISLKAVRLQMNAEPAPAIKKPTPAELANAFTAVTERMTPGQRRQFLNDMAKIETLSAVESCKTVRLVFSLMSKAQGDTQAVLARAGWVKR